MKEITFKVKMACRGCEMAIENLFSTMNAIKYCKADRREGKVKIRYDETLINIEEIKRIIESTGREVVNE